MSNVICVWSHIVVLLIALFCQGCKIPTKYSTFFVNNANYDVYDYVAFGYGENKAYPDTTIFFSKPNGFTKSYGYQITPTNEPLVEIIDQISSDTLSVYYFHSDTLAKYSWEEIRRDYKVLRRYDLSVEDVKKLYNKYSVPEIPYPPDARMKDMKMWPPYETK